MSSDTTEAKDQHAIIVRMPKELHDELAAYAKRQHRSVNGEVVHMIQRHVKEGKA